MVAWAGFKVQVDVLSRSCREFEQRGQEQGVGLLWKPVPGADRAPYSYP